MLLYKWKKLNLNDCLRAQEIIITISTYIRLGGAALLPVALAILMYMAEKKTRFGHMPYWLRQIIVGLVFGASACLATEYGVAIPGAVVNVRSASPLTAALLFGGPSGVIAGIIGGVHRWLAVYWGAGMFVTAWMGALDLSTGMLSYVNAGHNPPLIRRKNGAFEYLRTRPNFVLAGMDGVRYKKHELQLFPGDDIFLYTDGVTEATDVHQQLYGEDRLAEMLSASDKHKTDELCRIIRSDIDAFVGDAPQFDDITMLCVKINHIENENSILSYPEMANVATVAEFVEKRLEKWEVGMRTANRVQIALDEIYSNILRYSGASESRVSVSCDESSVTLEFEDNGREYDPTAAADPDITLSAEEREIGGLGIFMVKKSTRSMDYCYEDNKNKLKLVFDRQEGKKN